MNNSSSVHILIPPSPFVLASSNHQFITLYAKNYQSIEEARSGVFGYIEIFYNRKRRHSTNDGVSPVAFEEKAAIAA